jgi:hypothetical protein
VTSDPASVESLLNWAAQLQNRVSYLAACRTDYDKNHYKLSPSR